MSTDYGVHASPQPAMANPWQMAVRMTLIEGAANAKTTRSKSFFMNEKPEIAVDSDGDQKSEGKLNNLVI